MKEIVLFRWRGVAIVDDHDYQWLNAMEWRLVNGYAMLRRDRTYPYMHHFLLPKKDGFDVDHINGNTLDNRRANLRYLTHNQNLHNRGKASNNTSGYRGVYYNQLARKWVSQLTVKRQHYHLGYFETSREAAIAFNEAAKRIIGESAWLNPV